MHALRGTALAERHPMLRMLALTCLAGCLDLPASAEVKGSGTFSGLQTESVRCDVSATLDRYAAGAGPVGIEVFDGSHDAVFDASDGVTGEARDSHDLSGAIGEWTLAVDASGFAGQIDISLSCL